MPGETRRQRRCGGEPLRELDDTWWMDFGELSTKNSNARQLIVRLIESQLRVCEA